VLEAVFQVYVCAGSCISGLGMCWKLYFQFRYVLEAVNFLIATADVPVSGNSFMFVAVDFPRDSQRSEARMRVGETIPS
jgi:hypothetical protein